MAGERDNQIKERGIQLQFSRACNRECLKWNVIFGSFMTFMIVSGYFITGEGPFSFITVVLFWWLLGVASNLWLGLNTLQEFAVRRGEIRIVRQKNAVVIDPHTIKAVKYAPIQTGVTLVTMLIEREATRVKERFVVPEERVDYIRKPIDEVLEYLKRYGPVRRWVFPKI